MNFDALFREREKLKAKSTSLFTDRGIFVFAQYRYFEHYHFRIRFYSNEQSEKVCCASTMNGCQFGLLPFPCDN